MRARPTFSGSFQILLGGKFVALDAHTLRGYVHEVGKPSKSTKKSKLWVSFLHSGSFFVTNGGNLAAATSIDC